MENLIRYCCDKGIKNFEVFKFERKSRIVMREHLVSNKDVKKYELLPYIVMDKYGRCKIPKYFLKELSAAIYWSKYRLSRYDKKFSENDIKNMLLNPTSNTVKEILNNLQEQLDKDPIRSRILKIVQIKNNLKNEKN